MSGLELVRWALYVDLGVLFGVPAAGWLVQAGTVPGTVRRALLGMAVLALPLSAEGFLLLVAQMAGTGIGDLDRGLVQELLTGLALGWAFIARMAALVVASACLAAPRIGERWLCLPPAIAVATLAWTGHTAASEGSLGLFRLLGDIAHLLAASTWLGALVLFLIMLIGGGDISETAEALARFSGVGSVLVGVLLITGIGNLLFLTAPSEWIDLAKGAYGRLLIVKLGMFGAMLGLAALNRFLFVPRLSASIANTRGQESVRHLRLSIFAELALGAAVLLIVASLGQLDPWAM